MSDHPDLSRRLADTHDEFVADLERHLSKPLVATPGSDGRPIAAAGGTCAPIAPFYQFASASSEDRPVSDARDALPFITVRGGITWEPGPPSSIPSRVDRIRRRVMAKRRALAWQLHRLARRVGDEAEPDRWDD